MQECIVLQTFILFVCRNGIIEKPFCFQGPAWSNLCEGVDVWNDSSLGHFFTLYICCSLMKRTKRVIKSNPSALMFCCVTEDISPCCCWPLQICGCSDMIQNGVGAEGLMHFTSVSKGKKVVLFIQPPADDIVEFLPRRSVLVAWPPACAEVSRISCLSFQAEKYPQFVGKMWVLDFSWTDHSCRLDNNKVENGQHQSVLCFCCCQWMNFPQR